MENKHIIGAGAIGLLVLLITLFIFQSNNAKDQTSSDLINLDFNKKQTASIQEITDLKIQDLKVGTGSAEVEIGDSISVHYAGFLIDGRKFDSSYDRGQPFEVEIGNGKVIRGFDQGVLKMRIGGKRRIFIPPDLGYGPQQQGPIPPNSSLIFEVEILDIKKKNEIPSPSPEVISDPTPSVNDPALNASPSGNP